MNEKNFFSEHFWEIIFAFPAAVLVEIFLRPIRKLYKRFFSEKIQNFIKTRKRNREETLHETEISKSINSYFDSAAPSRYIVGAIKNHNSLSQNRRFHYTDISKKYHLCREFKLKQTIADGTEIFFEEICTAIADKVSFNNTDIVLFLEKDTNGLFAREFAKNHVGNIKSHSIIYKEERGWFNKKVKRNYKYEIGESLVGTDVILIESLLIFPETVLDTIEWIKSKGANVKNVVILFDATGQIVDDFGYCKIGSENAILGASIDLKLSSVSNCKCKDKVKLKVLKYDKY